MAQRVGRGIALLFHDGGTRRGYEWSAARPGRTLPTGKTRYPLCRRLGGHPGAVWTGGKYITIILYIYRKRDIDPVTGPVWPRWWVEV